MIKEYDKCLRCGRKLKSSINRKRGYGEVCWNKLKIQSKGRLFNVTENNKTAE